MVRKLFLAFIAALLVGCSACSPSVESDDSSEAGKIYWDSCSQNIGDNPCNFSLVDQNGDVVDLYSFAGSPVVIDFSVMWCGPCIMAASEVQHMQDKYSSYNLQYLTILIETSYGSEPTGADCESWANSHGINTAPVLAGDRGMIDPSGQSGWPISSWPTFFFIDDSMTIHSSLRGFNSNTVDSMILEMLEE